MNKCYQLLADIAHGGFDIHLCCNDAAIVRALLEGASISSLVNNLTQAVAELVEARVKHVINNIVEMLTKLQ